MGNKSDDLVAFCTECNSDQPDQYIENNSFYKQGSSVPCKYCYGVTVITTYGQRKVAKEQIDRQRGL